MLNQRAGSVIGDVDGALQQLGRAAGVAGSHVGHDRGPDIGEGRRHLERLQVVEEQLGSLRPILGPALTHAGVAVLAQQRAQLAVDPLALRAADGVALADGPQEADAPQEIAGRDVGRSQVGANERLEGPVELDQPLEGAEPVIGPSAVVIEARRETQPVALPVFAPVLAFDVVGDDPCPLRRGPGHEDLGRDPEAVHAAELRRVPRRADGRAARRWRRDADGCSSEPSGQARVAALPRSRAWS